MKIVGTGSCLPQRVVSNDDLAAIMDTSDEWISSRTGIRNRHIATTETTTSLACDAVKSALQDAGIDGSEIDFDNSGKRIHRQNRSIARMSDSG